jgi:uncharacterized protein (DUF849 family)
VLRSRRSARQGRDTSKSVIITCAPTGGIHTPTMSPHLPVTPEEIASASIEAAEAGAAIIHLHARNPETGQPEPRPELFLEVMPQIASACDAVLNVSTGGGLGMTREERLRAATATSPEMASLNVGSLNFGIFPMLAKHSQWKHEWEPAFLEMTRDFVFKNTFADIEYVEWSVLAAGRHQMSFATQAAMLGGNVRVGMEDSLFIGPGEPTLSNASQVKKIRGIVESLGYPVATPAEARQRLALKGADHVTF